MHHNLLIGKIGEEIATKYLQNNSIIVIQRNFYCRFGEIDIIAKDKNELVFIEVKTRTTNKYGKPSEAVNLQKQKHLRKSIEYYLYSNKITNAKVRIDVMEIYLNKAKSKLNHIRNIYL